MKSLLLHCKRTFLSLGAIFISSQFISLWAIAGPSDSSDRKSTETISVSSLRVMVILGKPTYKINERIVVQVLLANTSKSPVYIYSPLEWGQSASVSLWIKDLHSGKDVAQTTISDALPPPPSSKDDFVKLLPNHIFGIALTTDALELGADQGGTYELVAQYHSPIPSDMNFGLPILSRETGSISSSPILLRVEK
jgi:hypothetical protein